jgi:hypothetical protein
MKKRVKIPMRNAKSLLNLAKQVRDKHMTDGDASPLKVLNWAIVGPIIDQALATDEKADQLKREKLKMFQQRQLQLQQLTDIVRDSRDILTGVYSKQMKVLGEWGFDVLDNRVTSSGEEEATQVKV